MILDYFYELLSCESHFEIIKFAFNLSSRVPCSFSVFADPYLVKNWHNTKAVTDMHVKHTYSVNILKFVSKLYIRTYIEMFPLEIFYPHQN